MRYFLSSRNRQILEKFARSSTLIGLDYDGTLAPIGGNRHRAMIQPSTRNLLATLAKLYPCVVVSGRSGRDLRRRLKGIDVSGIIGNHGIEPWSATAGFARSVRRWLPLLKDRLRTHRGVTIENKKFSVSVHYRHAPRRKQAARAAIVAAGGELGAVRLVGGKEVINILPARAPHKGTALKREIKRAGCAKAIYIGDDDTDEDVFALSDPERFLTIRVGRNRSSRATYYLRTQREIERVMQTLIDLRRSDTGSSQAK